MKAAHRSTLHPLLHARNSPNRILPCAARYPLEGGYWTLSQNCKDRPKSIGVGQYQHDVDQNRLKNNLDETVMSCVNQVGVKVNLASQQLLTYVSGLGPTLAKNVITYRNENGPFRSRADLKKVPRLGSKAFELAAGFLRIDNAHNPLDASAVHPESYHIVDRMAKDIGCTVADLMRNEDCANRLTLSVTREKIMDCQHCRTLC